MRFSPKIELCCDPFQTHKSPMVNDLICITEMLAKKHSKYNLVPGKKICFNCRNNLKIGKLSPEKVPSRLSPKKVPSKLSLKIVPSKLSPELLPEKVPPELSPKKVPSKHSPELLPKKVLPKFSLKKVLPKFLPKKLLPKLSPEKVPPKHQSNLTNQPRTRTPSTSSEEFRDSEDNLDPDFDPDDEIELPLENESQKNLSKVSN